MTNKPLSKAPTPATCAGSPDAEPETSSQPGESPEPKQMQSDTSGGDGETYADAEALIAKESATKPKRLKVYAAVRIVDFALTALAPVDYDDPEGEQDWAPIGGGTTLSTDRETMFQLARKHNGLLMATSGLPGGRAMMGMQTRAERISMGHTGPY